MRSCRLQAETVSGTDRDRELIDVKSKNEPQKEQGKEHLSRGMWYVQMSC